MANDINIAAHIDHSIKHTYADLGNFFGLAAGIVACVAITVFTGGIGGFVLGAGAVGLGGWLGEKVGGWFSEDDSGRIARGSPNVFYGPQVRAAARMNDRTACESPGMSFMETASPFLQIASPVFAPMGLLTYLRQADRQQTVELMRLQGLEVLESDIQNGAHAGSKIADGSISVLINLWPAARKDDGVFPCDGKISGGIESIVIGGPQGLLRGTEQRSEINRGQKSLQEVFSLIADPVGAGIALASLVADRNGWTGAKNVLDWAGAAWSVVSIFRGNPTRADRIMSGLNAGTGAWNAGQDTYRIFNPETHYEFDERTMSSRPRT